jgi:hypothetical protein
MMTCTDIAWKWQCPRCNAAPGAPCVNANGRPRKVLQTHNVRYAAGERAMHALERLGGSPLDRFSARGSYDWNSGSE